VPPWPPFRGWRGPPTTTVAVRPKPAVETDASTCRPTSATAAAASTAAQRGRSVWAGCANARVARHSAGATASLTVHRGKPSTPPPASACRHAHQTARRDRPASMGSVLRVRLVSTKPVAAASITPVQAIPCSPRAPAPSSDPTYLHANKRVSNIVWIIRRLAHNYRAPRRLVFSRKTAYNVWYFVGQLLNRGRPVPDAMPTLHARLLASLSFRRGLGPLSSLPFRITEHRLAF
jgi:hypothetical protein